MQEYNVVLPDDYSGDLSEFNGATSISMYELDYDNLPLSVTQLEVSNCMDVTVLNRLRETFVKTLVIHADAPMTWPVQIRLPPTVTCVHLSQIHVPAMSVLGHNLIELHLSECKIGSWTNLDSTHLSRLSLDDVECNFEGITRFPLTWLNLSFVSAEDMEEIAHLPLAELTLNVVNVPSTLWSDYRIYSLHTLELSNELDSHDFMSLARWSLRHLTLHKIDLSEVSPDDWFTSHHLNSLCLNSCALPDYFFEVIDAPNLDKLTLSGVIVPNLTKIGSPITHFILNRCRYVGDFLPQIIHLPLINLVINVDYILDEDLVIFSQLHLAELNLHSTVITSEGHQYLASLNIPSLHVENIGPLHKDRTDPLYTEHK